MTISSTTRKAGPYIGNGTASVFPFAFKVFQASDVEVVRLTVATNVETTMALTTDYTVSLNQDQDSNPGGSITLVAGALATGYNLVITSDVENLQPTDLTNQGGFYPDVINDALDRATIQIQQLQEGLDRTAKLPITSAEDADALVADIIRLADSAANIDTVAGSISNVNTTAGSIASVNTAAGNNANITTVATNIASVNAVAGNNANVTTVATNIASVNTTAGSIANVNAVAGNATNINAVAGNATNINAVNANKTNIDAVAGNATNINAVNANKANIDSVAGNATNINTVAGSNANVNTVATNIANVNTVAGISANVTTVAGIASDVSTAAANVADITNFADVYYGPSATDPTTRKDTSPLQVGDLYFNTISENMRVFNGTIWEDTGTAVPVTITIDKFNGTGSQTAFTLSTMPGFTNAVTVEVSGIGQRLGIDFTVTGTTLTFTSAPPLGTNNIYVVITSPYAGGVPNDGSVTAAKLSSTAVTDKLGYTPLNPGSNLSDVANTATARSNLGAQETLVSGINIKTINGSTVLGSGDLVIESSIAYGLFRKADPSIVAWTKTGAGTATTSSTLYIEVNGSILTIASGTSIAMPALSAGTDYAVWANTDGTLEATSNHTSPPTANARKVGGFHYAPGGHSGSRGGGNTTPGIWAGSFWDLKFRPTCPDPRGMEYKFCSWMDMYLTNTDAITLGSSRYNVTIADGSSPPKVPTVFGGNGSTTYGSYTWFEATELASFFEKRLPTQREFMAHAYGTTEASSIGSDQGSTIHNAANAAYMSAAGLFQATGVMWVWADDRGGPAAAASWNANTEGRGSEYNAPNAARLGGVWDDGAYAGSRSSGWNLAASNSSNSVGSRFCCDHLQLD